MTFAAFKAHPAVRVARRIVDVAVIIFIATHGIYACYAHATADTWEERVFIIERDWQFKLLNPLNDGIGFALPFVSVAYVSREAIDRLGTSIEGVRRHEGKHLQQVDHLGWLQYHRLDEWKREGMAEYVRGAPTISVCSPNPDEDANRLSYREFYVVTRYLIEQEGLTETELYEYEEYPLVQAEKWLSKMHC
jgi:hypothetical protein